MALTRLTVASPSEDGERLSDEVELYQRTYTTLLRSSGETRLRVLEPSHRAMGSSLHPLAASNELDLGAFLYAIRRLPDGIVGAAQGGVGGPLRGADVARGRRAPVDAGAHARRLAHRLRAAHAALVGARARAARHRGADRPAAVLRQLEHPLDREHRDRRGAG